MHVRNRTRLAWLATIVFLVLAVLPRDTANAAAGSAAPANAAGCGSALTQCTWTVLQWINHTRTQNGLPPLKLQEGQSHGTASCVGAYGHSIAMARTGSIWHVNDSYPHASFPQDICLNYTHAGENVGQAPGGNILHDLLVLHHMMMAQPHDRATCATIENHACNILGPDFHQAGIGIYYAHGRAWLTESFVG